MDPLIITVAPTGAEVLPNQTPHLPYTAQMLGETAAACRAAGAAMMHIHGRRSDGRPTQDVETYRAFADAVRAKSDLIIQFSTGGAVGMTPQERAVNLELRPEMATLTCGTVNFGDDVFENSFPVIRGILARMREFDVVPELEIFDLGHLDNARRLEREGLLTFPRHVDIVLNVPGGAEGSVENLVDIARRLPGGCTWSVAGVGRAQLPLAAAAIAMGGHVRVGLEDNLYYAKGRLARNEELVARVARLAEELQRPVATPDEARDLLGLRRTAVR